MHIRVLKHKDAHFMLEWMQDDFVVHDLFTDFGAKKIEDCKSFIKEAIEQYGKNEDSSDIHLAVADEDDEYMGTVSLKNIDRIGRKAEFAIALRRKAIGQGYGKYAMDEMLKIGFCDPGLLLKDIYWCVNKNNLRARRFYDKQNYKIVESNLDMMINYQGKIGGVLN